MEYGVRVTNLTQGGLSAMEELENLEERREENAKEDQRFPKDAERLGSDRSEERRVGKECRL